LNKRIYRTDMYNTPNRLVCACCAKEFDRKDFLLDYKLEYTYKNVKKAHPGLCVECDYKIHYKKLIAIVDIYKKRKRILKQETVKRTGLIVWLNKEELRSVFNILVKDIKPINFVPRVITNFVLYSHDLQSYEDNCEELIKTLTEEEKRVLKDFYYKHYKIEIDKVPKKCARLLL